MEFFDTNILVYAVDEKEPARRRIALRLLGESLDKGTLVISTQVMLEFRSTALRRQHLSAERITEFLRDFGGEHIVPAHEDMVWQAFDLQDRYGFSIWDAAIVQAALDARCDVLYTEDLQHGQRIGSLEIVNPFRAAAVHEAATAYVVERKPATKKRR